MLIGIEACGTAHYWARELSTLGHDVRLMPPAYVKPYVKRQKNDAAGAEARCPFGLIRFEVSSGPARAPDNEAQPFHTGADDDHR